jgi:Derlin-2/3
MLVIHIQICAPFFNLVFLSESLFMCIMYLMSKRNRNHEFAIVGMPMLRIPGAFLPYVFLMLGFDKERLLGMVVGHVYYYFEDVFPKLPVSKGFRLFKTPGFM